MAAAATFALFEYGLDTNGLSWLIPAYSIASSLRPT